MLSYKDKTFCVASGKKCINTECYRYLSEGERANAVRLNLLIAYADFYDNCGDKIEKVKD